MATVRKRIWNKGTPNEKTAWIADYFDQQGDRHIKTFPRQAEAKAWLAETTIQVKQGTHTAERQSVTVAQAAELWFENRRDVEKLETATLKQYRNHIRLHIVPKIGGIRLAQLSAPIVDDFKDRLLAANSRVMTGKVLTSLRSILAHAQAKGRVGHNAAAAVRLGAKQRRESGRLEIGRDIPAKDEVRRILDAVQGTRWHPILATAAMAGLRSSELRGLRWDDLDLDVGILRVRQRADETGNMGSPKSAAGTRDIPMSPWLVNVLKRWRLECPRAKGVLDLVFPNGKGHVENHANIANRGLYATERKLGILDAAGSPRYGMHSLRHFFASLMIEQNHLPKRVQEMLGHSSLQMTYDRYGHLFPAGDGERTKMEQASAFLAATKSA